MWGTLWTDAAVLWMVLAEMLTREAVDSRSTMVVAAVARLLGFIGAIQRLRRDLGIKQIEALVDARRRVHHSCRLVPDP
jgi:hypothetical protein